MKTIQSAPKFDLAISIPNWTLCVTRYEVREKFALDLRHKAHFMSRNAFRPWTILVISFLLFAEFLCASQLHLLGELSVDPDGSSSFRIEKIHTESGSLPRDSVAETPHFPKNIEVIQGTGIPISAVPDEQGRIVKVAPKSLPTIESATVNTTAPWWKKHLPINAHLTNYVNSYSNAITPNADRDSIKEAIEDGRELRSAINGVTLDLLKDISDPEAGPISSDQIQFLSDSRDFLTDESRFLNSRISEKGVYRSPSTYEIQTYTLLVANVGSSGVIAENTNHHGSCTHIGNGYFLTASHVIKRKKLNNLSVTFFGTVNPQPFELILDLDRALSNRSDIALCRIKNWKESPLNIPPVRIRSAPESLNVGTGLYVLGYPNKKNVSLVINDDCSVVIPYKAESDVILDLFVSLTLRKRETWCATPSVNLRLSIANLDSAFKEIYGFDYKEYNVNSERDYTASYSGYPIMGLDADTDFGDSGGGVFSKGSGEFVAVFCGGRKGGGALDAADAASFEYAIPVETFWSRIESIIKTQ